jgi:hypothetical protein
MPQASIVPVKNVDNSSFGVSLAYCSTSTLPQAVINAAVAEAISALNFIFNS